MAGCFRPLYAEAPTGGTSVQAALAAVDVAPVPDRMGHYLRQELMFELDGSGNPPPKTYRLKVNMSTNIATALVDSYQRADSATLQGTATYELVTISDNKKVAEGRAVSSTSYDRSSQRYATVRAARDAEIRLAKVLAEQIRVRIAAAIAAKS